MPAAAVAATGRIGQALTGLAVPAKFAPVSEQSTSHQPTGERAGRLLFALACLVFLVAGLRNITTPWEGGMRGSCGGGYSDGAVSQTLAYGLAVTRGTPAFIVDDDGTLIRYVNWHHPPLYWLFLSGCAWLFGHEPWLLRLVQLLLFAPGLVALFALARRWAGPTAAGFTTLVFTTNPLIGYFGPMVLQDGAVLSFGLLTMWSFDRHLAAPTWRSWWRTAACFFVVTSLDHTGHFWGLGMFALALAVPQRRRAILSVFSFFPVSVAAFLVMVLHYELALDGPDWFLKQILSLFTDEAGRVQAEPLEPRVRRAVDELFVRYGNWPLFALALLGSTLAVFARSGPARALARLGFVLLVPGVCCEVVMFGHALDHVFWPMQGFAGLGALGAIVPVTGSLLLAAAGPARRASGALLLVATLAAVVRGTLCTHAVISRYEFVENGTIAVIEKARPELLGCSTTLTSAPAVGRRYFGHTVVHYSIDTPEALQNMLALARAINGRGTLAFVVHPDHTNSPLTQLLDTMARPIAVDDVVVYRFRL